MDKKEELNQLFEKIKIFDQTAFTKFIELTQSDLIKVAFLYLRDKMLAEDIVNDTYLSLIDNLKKFKHTDNIFGWLKVVVTNKSLNLIKKRNREKSAEDTNLYYQIDRNVISEDFADNLIIRECLSKLQEQERLVLLYNAYGFTINEICAETNFSIKKVRLLLDKAKKKFIFFYEKD